MPTTENTFNTPLELRENQYVNTATYTSGTPIEYTYVDPKVHILTKSSDNELKPKENISYAQVPKPVNSAEENKSYARVHKATNNAKKNKSHQSA